MEEQLCISGPIDQLDATLEALHRELYREIAAGEVQISRHSRPASDLLSRDPLRQIEIVEIIIAMAINLLSSAAYESIKLRIKNIAQEKDFTLANHATEESDSPRENVNTVAKNIGQSVQQDGTSKSASTSDDSMDADEEQNENA